jgi:hypothetical protein
MATIVGLILLRRDERTGPVDGPSAAPAAPAAKRPPPPPPRRRTRR